MKREELISQITEAGVKLAKMDGHGKTRGLHEFRFCTTFVKNGATQMTFIYEGADKKTAALTHSIMTRAFTGYVSHFIDFQNGGDVDEVRKHIRIGTGLVITMTIGTMGDDD